MKSHFLKTLQLLEGQAQEKPLQIKDIFNALGDTSHLILILFLTLPFLQPIPLPGLSTLFAVLIVVLAFLNYFGKPVKLPHSYNEKFISQKLMFSILKGAEKIWNFLEKFLKVRWSFFFRSRFFKAFNVLVICVQALLLALPIPIPFSNKVPALAIAVMVIGELEEDGVMILISYIISVLSIAFFGGLFLGFKSGFDFMQ